MYCPYCHQHISDPKDIGYLYDPVSKEGNWYDPKTNLKQYEKREPELFPDNYFKYLDNDPFMMTLTHVPKVFSIVTTTEILPVYVGNQWVTNIKIWSVRVVQGCHIPLPNETVQVVHANSKYKQ